MNCHLSPRANSGATRCFDVARDVLSVAVWIVLMSVDAEGTLLAIRLTSLLEDGVSATRHGI